MPCTHPLQGIFFPIIKKSGEPGRKFKVVPQLMERFRKGLLMPKSDEYTEYGANPCGNCIGCRLEKSRQIGLRCLHESKMYEDNCFVTLTYSQESLERMCPLTDGGYSLVRKHTQDFMKRLRARFDDRKLKVYGCGEYGGKFQRPHYHLCIFNLDFLDKQKFCKIHNFWHYNSPILSDLWPFGFATVTDFSFDTACYTARYCTKKINGKKADDHYKGRIPEFPIYPTRSGGIGKTWFDKFARTDIFPHDTCIVNGHECKTPRYYDKLREREDPQGFAQAKELRALAAKERESDNTHARLLVKEKCINVRMKQLIRKLEQ